MKSRHKRFLLIAAAGLLLSAAVALILNAFRDNLVFFHTPSDVAQGKAPQNRPIRLGGMVSKGSLQREADGLTVHFRITDMAHDIPVTYKGILPDLFKEGKGAVVQGQVQGGQFQANEVLAKHDENYMPPEAAAALEQAKKAQQTLKP